MYLFSFSVNHLEMLDLFYVPLIVTQNRSVPTVAAVSTNVTAHSDLGYVAKADNFMTIIKVVDKTKLEFLIQPSTSHVRYQHGLHYFIVYRPISLLIHHHTSFRVPPHTRVLHSL